MAPSARDQPVSFTRLPVLDDYANKHWNGLVRDFYAKRVECYVNQAALDVPAVPPTPGVCKMGALMAGTYLSNYPKSLGSGGIQPPAKWPYNASSLESAAAWCCKHGDCGGVTHQNGRQATIISALFLRLCGVIVASCFFFNSFIHSFIHSSSLQVRGPCWELSNQRNRRQLCEQKRGRPKHWESHKVRDDCRDGLYAGYD